MFLELQKKRSIQWEKSQIYFLFLLPEVPLTIPCQLSSLPRPPPSSTTLSASAIIATPPSITGIAATDPAVSSGVRSDGEGAGVDVWGRVQGSSGTHERVVCCDGAWGGWRKRRGSFLGIYSPKLLEIGNDAKFIFTQEAWVILKSHGKLWKRQMPYIRG